MQLKQLADSGRPLDISLTNDFAFKKTFRNKIALTGLLSSLLDIPAGEITSLEFPDTFLHGEYAEDREGILDVKVRLNHCKKSEYRNTAFVTSFLGGTEPLLYQPYVYRRFF